MLPILHINRHLRTTAAEFNLSLDKVLELLRYDLITGDVESSLRRTTAVMDNFSHLSRLEFGFNISQRNNIIQTMRGLSYEWASTSLDGKSMVFINTMENRNMEVLFISADVSLTADEGPVQVLTQIQHFSFNEKPYFPLSVISDIDDLRGKEIDTVTQLLSTLRLKDFPSRHAGLPNYHKFVNAFGYTTMEGGTIDWPGKCSFDMKVDNTDNIQPFMDCIIKRVPNAQLFKTDGRHTAMIEVKPSRAGLGEASTFIVIEPLPLPEIDAKNQEYLDNNDPLKSKIRRISVDVWGQDKNYCDLISNLLESDLQGVADHYNETVAEWRQKLSALKELTSVVYEGDGILREEAIPNLPGSKIEELEVQTPVASAQVPTTPRPWWKFW